MAIFYWLWDWVWNQVRPVAYKEFVHILNDPSTLRIAILLPIVQLTIFGYAINMDISNIKTIVLNEDGGPESNRLLERLQNTTYFTIKGYVQDKDAVLTAMRRGDANIGIVIPAQYSGNLAINRPAHFQVLIDGSQSTLATQALAAVTQLGGVISQDKLASQKQGSVFSAQKVQAVPYVMYNPSLKTSVFTIPGLLGIVLLNVTLFLTTFSLVKEREQGTMDQLMVTPLRRSGLLVGKIVPYVILGLFDFNLVVLAMILLFHINIQGSIFLMEFCALLFLISILGTGLLISSRSTSQMGAAQTAGLVVLPSVLLSGFVFSIDSMPKLMQGISYSMPMTYFIQCLRAIILRGAGFMDILYPMSMLLLIGLLILTVSVYSFKRRVN